MVFRGALEKTLSNMYTSVPRLSEGLWGFNGIDVVSTDAVVDELGTRGENSYYIKPNLDCVSRVLDKYIDKAQKESGKRYDQIIAVSDLKAVANGWFGLGGSTYKGVNFCQVSYGSGDNWEAIFRSGFTEGVFVHEMLHCVERISRNELKSPTQILHANVDVYGETYQNIRWQDGWDGNGTYYSDYMRCKTPDGLGVDKKAFYSYRNCTYKVVYGSEPDYTKTDVSTLNISKPKNYTYTGEAIKPALTVKDGARTLVRGRDYTLVYVNNTEAGYAAVIVNGKGSYSGKYSQNFIIKPKKTTLKVTKTGSRYTFSWNKDTGANKYEIYSSTDGGRKYKLLRTVESIMDSVTIKLSTSKSYRFKIRSVKELYPQKFYIDSAAVTAKTATAKNSNETFKYGKLYAITSKDSGKAMDIADATKDNGGNLIQYTYSGKKSQKWYLEQQSDGYYVIKNYNSAKVITVDDSGNAVQQKYTGAELQQWLISKEGNYYKIINRQSGKALDVYAFNKSDGANIVQWAYGGKDNQLWSIKAA